MQLPSGGICSVPTETSSLGVAKVKRDAASRPMMVVIMASGIENPATVRRMIRAFWEQQGSQYDARSSHRIFSASERQLWTASLAAIPGPARVLDIGTGTGFVASILAGLGHRVTGLDASAAMLANARANAAKQGVDITFTQGLTESLHFDDAGFDAVTARHVIWTLLEPGRAFGEWRRVLVAGGLLIADCSLDPRVAAHHYTDTVAAALPFGDITDPSPVVRALSAAGFTEVATEVLADEEYQRAMLRCRAGNEPESASAT